jgi:hypothetical protein
VDYKFFTEKKASNFFHAIVANNTDILDPTYYNAENIEWACLILDSRIIYVNFEAFLIPMLDFANYKENPQNPSRTLKPKFTNEANTYTEIKAIADFTKGEQLFENPGYNGDHLLLYHGISLPDSYSNCYSMSLTFSERQDDPLKTRRKEFFSKYFLFDRNHIDMM